jgi:hypothetical protein
MNILINSLSTSDKVQIISIISTFTISVVSIMIALSTLIQTKKSNIEANRAYIVLYITRDRDDILYSLNIKNFGKTSGSLIGIILDPPLSFEKSITSLKVKTITEFKDVYLAPNQSIRTLFDFRQYKDTRFNATITYKCGEKIYSDTYVLDLEYFSSIITSSNTIKDQEDALIHINTSIRNMADKMN